MNVWGTEFSSQYWQRKASPGISKVSGKIPIDLLVLLLLQMCQDISDVDVGVSILAAEQSRNKKLVIHMGEIGKIRF